ncbi:hypothetical protein ACFQYP_17250 [Nonomuraea antimicrobica]
MIQVQVHDTTLSVRFPSWTRLFVKAGQVSVPLAAIADVHHLDRPLAAAKGCDPAWSSAATPSSAPGRPSAASSSWWEPIEVSRACESS